jgi:hypoxanthine phosphoribosyltransferase
LKTEKKFDRVIALAKGGVTFSRSLVDYLKIEHYSSIQIEFYTGIAQTNRTPVITQSLPTSIKDEHVLVFDDIADSGETLQLATQYFKYHGAADVTTAVLIKKPWSSYAPAFSARSSEAWIIFPNEVRESIELLTQTWRKAGDSSAKITEQLLEIGFSKSEVALFAQAR